MSNQSNRNPGSDRLIFLAIFGAIALTMLGGAWWVLSFVNSATQPEITGEVIDEASLIYVNFDNNVDDIVSAEAYLAMGNYLLENEETINVQVLVGETPQNIVGYMLNHFSAGLGVNCDYCHSLENFAADEWDDPVAMANKDMARTHARMTADLNQIWLAQLPEWTDDKKPSGSQVACATCHYGEPQPVSYEEELVGLPNDFRLPLDQPLSLEEVDILNVNARTDISLDTVQYQQYVMYHMNASLNVGCTHCHNSRYFPSWEVPAKYYAQHMLAMSQFVLEEYGETMSQPPSCTLCHRGAVIPPGAARSIDVMPAALVPQVEG